MAFALTLSVAGWVERNLAVLGLERRDALLRSFRANERRWSSEPVLLVAGNGEVVDLNPAAASLLKLSGAASQLRLAELAPELWDAGREAFERGGCREETLVLRAPGARPSSVTCRIEPVAVDGRSAGIVLVISQRSAGPAAGRALQAGAGRAPLASARALPRRVGIRDLLGESPALLEALKLASAVSGGAQQKPVLILGESGTGKELIAQAIHAESARGNRPFVAVNCGALPRELVESELFGYSFGAFTGARREGQAGKFEAAQGGTLFLDEIDSMPLEAQAKLLRVVETREVVRLGSTRPVALDVAIMAASVQDLRRRVEEGAFRLDLFHRLSVVEIVMPPLRERRGDIMLLASVFLENEFAALGREPLSFSPEAVQRLLSYHWPGNIRELQNLCARWAMTVTGREIRAADVPLQVRGGPERSAEAEAGLTLRGQEDAIIRQTLLETGGSVTEAARRLSVNKTTIYRRMKRWQSRTGGCSMH
jgi:transcriptional regulator with PAS, ATPase and Fis domain